MALPFWMCCVCTAVKTPIFSTAVTQWPHIFIENWWLSLNDTIFFLAICHSNPGICEFQQQIGYFKLFCAQSSFLKLEIQYKLLLWDWNGSHWKTKNYIFTQCPHNFGPKCGLSPNDPISFKYFSHLTSVGVKTGAPHLYRSHIWLPPWP